MTTLTRASTAGVAGAISERTYQGLSGLLVRRGLRRIDRDGIVLGTSGALRSLRILPSGLDTELSHAADVAAEQRRPLVAVLPLPLPAAPVALAAAATIAAIAVRGRVQARTAVVSPRLAGRQMYDELLVGRERLSALVPRISPGDVPGESSVVTAHDSAQLLALESLDSLTGLVLDLDTLELSDLARVLRHAKHRSPRRPLLLLALASSPLDPAVTALRQANALVYAVDQEALAWQASVTPEPGPGDGRSLICGAAELKRASAGTLEVRECWDPALDLATEAMWAATAALGRTGDGSVWHAGNLRWAWGIVSSFCQLATSAARADHHAPRGPWGPLMLLDAPRRARDLAVSENESLWLRFAGAVDAGIAASERECKAGTIAALAAVLAQGRGQQLLVLARNRASAAALRSALLEIPRTPALVVVASVRDFAASRVHIQEDALVLGTGPLPRRYAAWTCVPLAGGLVLLTAGPWQTLRAVEQAVDARAALAGARRDSVAEGLAATGPSPVDMQVGPASAVVVADGRHASFEVGQGRWDDQARRWLISRKCQAGNVELPARELRADGLWSPFEADSLAIIERCAGRGPGSSDRVFETDAEDGFSAAADASAISSGGLVEVFPVSLRPLGGGDPCTLLQPPRELVTRRDGLQVKAVAARALREGDLVALVDGDARRGVFEHVVDTLEESPDWELPAKLARLWQQCVQSVSDSGMTYEEIRRCSGISVQARQIRKWARGEVDRPLDPGDVRRLARVLNDHEVLSRAEAVATALRALSQMHLEAGRWLSATLAYASRLGLGDNALRGRPPDTVLDRRLGLRASDLLGSIRLYRVAAVGDACCAPSGATSRPLPATVALQVCSPLRSADAVPARNGHADRRELRVPGDEGTPTHPVLRPPEWRASFVGAGS